MTKHQKQAHDSHSKRSCLQWRPLNENLIMNKRSKAIKTQPWRPLDEILQSGIQQQQLKSVEPASPVPSEKSSGTIDEDYFELHPNSTMLDQPHQWLAPPLCNGEKSYYPPMTVDDANTPIFYNYQPFELLYYGGNVTP